MKSKEVEEMSDVCQNGGMIMNVNDYGEN